jgi:hypothetical protein
VEAPKVFISYSHDSSDHAERVLALSDKLRQEGIDCHIDQYEVSPPEGWPRWMENRIEWADFVVVVCTETYNLRFRGKAPSGQGKGVKWEGAILTQNLYQDLRSFILKKIKKLNYSKCYDFQCPLYLKYFQRTA